MYLYHFEHNLKLHYPEWQQTYRPLIKSKNSLYANAYMDFEIIGIFKSDKKNTLWYLRKPDGNYIKSMGVSGFVYITKEEFWNNVVKQTHGKRDKLEVELESDCDPSSHNNAKE